MKRAKKEWIEKQCNEIEENLGKKQQQEGI